MAFRSLDGRRRDARDVGSDIQVVDCAIWNPRHGHGRRLRGRKTMFDPDDYELHEAQKHACKMARERDEARVMADRLADELAKCAAVLPGCTTWTRPMVAMSR